MPLALLEAEGRVSTMDSPAIQPPVFFFFFLPENTGDLDSGLVTAYCSKPVKDSRGSQSNIYALASFSLTESAVASSESPRDVPPGVLPPAGLEVVPSLLYNQCMFPADVSRSCPGAI